MIILGKDQYTVIYLNCIREAGIGCVPDICSHFTGTLGANETGETVSMKSDILLGVSRKLYPASINLKALCSPVGRRSVFIRPPALIGSGSFFIIPDDKARRADLG